ncbi:MAG: HNH endonuclease signature motif containing protein [Actinomycetota bacterium]
MQHWTRQGPTSLDNLIYLCTFHHRLVHEGGYGVEGEPGSVRFRRPASQGGDLVELVRPEATTPEAIALDNANRGLESNLILRSPVGMVPTFTGATSSGRSLKMIPDSTTHPIPIQIQIPKFLTPYPVLPQSSSDSTIRIRPETPLILTSVP